MMVTVVPVDEPGMIFQLNWRTKSQYVQFSDCYFNHKQQSENQMQQSCGVEPAIFIQNRVCYPGPRAIFLFENGVPRTAASRHQ
jgi:hypothetical protein